MHSILTMALIDRKWARLASAWGLVGLNRSSRCFNRLHQTCSVALCHICQSNNISSRISILYTSTHSVPQHQLKNTCYKNQFILSGSQWLMIIYILTLATSIVKLALLVLKTCCISLIPPICLNCSLEYGECTTAWCITDNAAYWACSLHSSLTV